MSTYLGPFPIEAYKIVSNLQGNQKCCDCSSLETDWGSVSHGILLCLECAGKHRSLGVHVSFVRSIHMDTWSPIQIEMMKCGGNGQLREFFENLQIENSPIDVLYRSKAAGQYREKLKDHAEKVLSGIIPPDQKTLKIKPKKSELSPSNKKADPQKDNLLEQIEVTFPEGPMGMTLTKDSKDGALVSRLVPAGSADHLGIKVGDIVIGVAGKVLRDYEDIMHMIPYMSRPLKIKFERVRTNVSKANRTPIATTLGTSHEHHSKNNNVEDSEEEENSHRNSSKPAYLFTATSDPPPAVITKKKSKTKSNGNLPIAPPANLTSASPAAAATGLKSTADTPSNKTTIKSTNKTEIPTPPAPPTTSTITATPVKLRLRRSKEDLASLDNKLSLEPEGGVYNVTPKAIKKISKSAKKEKPSESPNNDENSSTVKTTTTATVALKSTNKNKKTNNQPSTVTMDVTEAEVSSENNDCSNNSNNNISTTAELADVEVNLSKIEINGSDHSNMNSRNSSNNLDTGEEQQQQQVVSSDCTGMESQEYQRNNNVLDAKNVEEEDDSKITEDVEVDDEEKKDEDDNNEDDDDEEEEEEEDDDDEEEEEDDEEEDDDDEEEEDEEEEDPESQNVDKLGESSSNNNSNKVQVPRVVVEEEEEEEEENEESMEASKIFLPQGTIVKVLKRTSLRSAVIKRRHKDGSYKIIYRDKTTESHVPLSRITVDNIEAYKTAAISTSSSPSFSKDTGNKHSNKYNNNDNGNDNDNENDNFIVSATENLEDWITKEEDDIDFSPSAFKINELKTKKAATHADDLELRRALEEQSLSSMASKDTGGNHFRVTFTEPPLGLTLTKSFNGRAEVTKVTVEGAAAREGVKVGDVVLGVHGKWMLGYDEVMAEIASKGYPVTLTLRRGLLEELARRSTGVAKESKILADKLLDQLGLKSKGILQSPTPVRLSNQRNNPLRSATSDKADANVLKSMRMSTKDELSKKEDNDEFDVHFGEGDLGMRLEERGGLVPISVVIQVTPDGLAASSQVGVGCTVVGVNGERYISHAHTVSTLKHSKRPVRVRFRRMDA